MSVVKDVDLEAMPTSIFLSDDDDDDKYGMSLSTCKTPRRSYDRDMGGQGLRNGGFDSVDECPTMFPGLPCTDQAKNSAANTCHITHCLFI